MAAGAVAVRAEIQTLPQRMLAAQAAQAPKTLYPQEVRRGLAAAVAVAGGRITRVQTAVRAVLRLTTAVAAAAAAMPLQRATAATARRASSLSPISSLRTLLSQ